jgi:hypothetical protein
MDDILEFSSLDHLLGLAAPPAGPPQPKAEGTLPIPGIGAPIDSMPQYQAYNEAQEAPVVQPPMQPVPTAPGDVLNTLRS